MMTRDKQRRQSTRPFCQFRSDADPEALRTSPRLGARSSARAGRGSKAPTAVDDALRCRRQRLRWRAELGRPRRRRGRPSRGRGCAKAAAFEECLNLYVR